MSAARTDETTVGRTAAAAATLMIAHLDVGAWWTSFFVSQCLGVTLGRISMGRAHIRFISESTQQITDHG